MAIPKYEYLALEPSPWTVAIDGCDIFDNFEDVFDEIDMFLRSHKESSARTGPRVKIRAVRQWWYAENNHRYDTIPDSLIDSICDGIPPSIFVFDFTDLFKATAVTSFYTNY